jgi:hypothetical protein
MVLMKTHIVMPIGVSQPGTPVLSLLEQSIDSILSQTKKDFIFTVAADENVSDECKKLLSDKGVDVKWFSPASFFRKGGIWKKISETWKTTDTKYLAFMHYDDLWDSSKLEVQIDLMEKENLNSSWSEVYVIDSSSLIVSQDCSSILETSRSRAGHISLAQAHATILNRESFFNSGIFEYEDRWSPVFEQLLVLFCHKMKSGKKANGAKFYWRNHDMNMSNSILTDSRWKDLMSEQRIIGEYAENDVNDDANFMHSEMRIILENIHD